MSPIIHKVIQADGDKLHVQLPKELAGKALEVIVRVSEDKETDSAFLQAAEQVLAKDWLTEQEEEAWKDL